MMLCIKFYDTWNYLQLKEENPPKKLHIEI